MKKEAEKLAQFYDVGRTCIFNYKNGSDGKKRLYNAMVEFYKKNELDTIEDELVSAISKNFGVPKHMLLGKQKNEKELENGK